MVITQIRHHLPSFAPVCMQRRPLSQGISTSSSAARRALCGLGLALSVAVCSPSGATIADTLNESRILDLARVLPAGEEARLATTLSDIEDASGIRVRLLTQTAGTAPGRSISSYFKLDPSSALIVVDDRGGNILNFNVGDRVYTTLPRSFWTELGNRFGNKFYVQDEGADRAILSAVDAIAQCTKPGLEKVCRVVPGVSNDQLSACTACAAFAGAMAGAALRTAGKKFNVTFLLLYSPIWLIGFGSFGMGPVLARESFFSPQFALVVSAFFVVGLVIWWWLPFILGPPADLKDSDI